MILFVNSLTVIDFSYLDLQRGMVGESYIVDVELHGSLDDTAMVFDFSKVKKVIKQAIDQSVDHKLALPSDCDALTLKDDSTCSMVNYKSLRGTISLASPAEAFACIPTKQINEQSVAHYLEQLIKPLLPDNVDALKIALRPEASTGFYYHYSHGLKKHDGNCQRIAHGHRSTIQIYTDGMLSPRLNKMWSERWQDSYLGSEADLCDAAALQLLNAEEDAYCFRYKATQGWFELVIPRSHCDIVPCDTTVECLADFIASELKTLDNSKTYKVVAYEGVAKGAIAQR
ncbi:6-pyruvoyl tetrahydropterin synthase [Arsukibacterium tuosuense]|uniref:6-carboxy-5,6,7,8-tetrahydropterin synthase n=1 Tax=Arsukibacterium tuosuense TaxID=1323745 RepID=A0A285I4Q7_9GAMM|nr:6-carboxytetrahydropterin synthase [Arsukibacterium tuosuense]SNY41911.1 6-pyruvoyl tetrahydropterin synthase [Arsukibacterium tuosuense]